jgi:chloride channel protein, CIC family
MAAIFAGASHALLASVVFAFETTRQPVGLLPLLAGCAAAYLVALLLDRHSIMTTKLARRGASVRTEYAADHLAHVLVRDAMSRAVVTLQAEETVQQVRDWLALAEDASPERPRGASSHQGFPVVDDRGALLGVVTRRDLHDLAASPGQTIRSLIRRSPVLVSERSTLRDAADLMVVEQVGRLPVVSHTRQKALVGIITRSDLLAAHATRLRAAHHRSRARTGLRSTG